MIAGEVAQQFFIGGINRDFRAALQNLPGGAGNVLALHQQAYRLAAGIQRPVDHLGTFGDEHTLGRLKTVEQLGFRQSGVHIQFRCGKIRNLHHIGQFLHILPEIFPIIPENRKNVKRFPVPVPGTGLVLL